MRLIVCEIRLFPTIAMHSFHTRVWLPELAMIQMGGGCIDSCQKLLTG